jgi:hypothetical protein
MMAKTSIILPNQPSTSLPKTGRSIGDTKPALPRRCVEYAMARPKTPNTAQACGPQSK